MTGKKKNHGTSERNGGADSVPQNAVAAHQKYAQDQIRSALNQHHPTPGAMFCHTPESAPGSGLSQHQGGRKKQNQQYGIAGGDIFGANASLNHGLAQDAEDGRDGEDNESAGAVADDENFSQRVQVSFGLGLALHGHQDFSPGAHAF